MRILITGGSGFLAACLSRLGARVTSLEIRPALADAARRALRESGTGSGESNRRRRANLRHYLLWTGQFMGGGLRRSPAPPGGGGGSRLCVPALRDARTR